MSNLNNFIAFLEQEVKNGSIYVWGGQGQRGDQITDSFIKMRESDTKNAQRVIAYKNKQIEAGYGSTFGAFDCSGLGMYWLCDLTGLFPNDLNANGMKGKCTAITKDQVCRGDWVFILNDGRATHIGYVVDDAGNVIEARGRDYGVCKTKLNQRPWNFFGRPEIFRKEIEAREAGFTSLRQGDKGTAVIALQLGLIYSGYPLAKYGADGSFGSETLNAVKKLQSDNNVTPDGVATDTEAALLGLENGFVIEDAAAVISKGHMDLLQKHEQLLNELACMISQYKT